MWLKWRIIGASMSEPHTSELNGKKNLCVCLSLSYVLVLNKDSSFGQNSYFVIILDSKNLFITVEPPL